MGMSNNMLNPVKLKDIMYVTIEEAVLFFKQFLKIEYILNILLLLVSHEQICKLSQNLPICLNSFCSIDAFRQLFHFAIETLSRSSHFHIVSI